MKLKLAVLEINIGEDTASFHLVPHKYIFEAKWLRKWPKWPWTDLQISKNPFFGFFSLQRPKMTLTQKIPNNSYQNRVVLYFLCPGHFWPLEAEKAKKRIFSIFASQSTAISAIFSAIWLQICTCGVPNESWQCPLQYLFPTIKV